MCATSGPATPITLACHTNATDRFVEHIAVFLPLVVIMKNTFAFKLLAPIYQIEGGFTSPLVPPPWLNDLEDGTRHSIYHEYAHFLGVQKNKFPGGTPMQNE